MALLTDCSGAKKGGIDFAVSRSCERKPGTSQWCVVPIPSQETEIANYAALEVSDQSWKDFGNQACLLACRNLS